MAENDPSFKALRIELSQLADRLAPHHFKVLSRSVGLWEREAHPAPVPRASAPFVEEKAFLPKEEPLPIQAPFVEPVHAEVLLGAEALEPQAEFNPFDAKFDTKWEERELRDDHAFVVEDSRSFLGKAFWFVTAHVFDMAMITACVLMTLLSFKVALLGYTETIQDGLGPLIEYWLQTFTWQELALGLYGIFLCYALLFYLIVGTTIGGILSRPRS